MKPITIVFSDIRSKEIGTVSFDGETLTPSNAATASFVNNDMENGMSAEDFVEKYSNWSNGHLYSEKLA